MVGTVGAAFAAIRTIDFAVLTERSVLRMNRGVNPLLQFRASECSLRDNSETGFGGGYLKTTPHSHTKPARRASFTAAPSSRARDAEQIVAMRLLAFRLEIFLPVVIQDHQLHALFADLHEELVRAGFDGGNRCDLRQLPSRVIGIHANNRLDAFEWIAAVGATDRGDSTSAVRSGHKILFGCRSNTTVPYPSFAGLANIHSVAKSRAAQVLFSGCGKLFADESRAEFLLFSSFARKIFSRRS